MDLQRRVGIPDVKLPPQGSHVKGWVSGVRRYMALGINLEGKEEVLRLWIEPNEDVKLPEPRPE